MDAQTIALIVGLIILVASLIGIVGLMMTTVLNKKQVLITTFCVLSFLLIQSQAVLIVEHYNNVAVAKRYVRRAKKEVTDALAALETCKKKHGLQQNADPDPYGPCYGEEYDLRDANRALNREEATLKATKAPLPLIGIIGILIIGSIVLAIIFKTRQTHP